MTLLDEPLLTQEMSREAFQPAFGSTYIHGTSVEDRSVLAAAWRDRCLRDYVRFAAIEEVGSDDIYAGSKHGNISLHNVAGLQTLLESFTQPAYLDITGLTYRGWAPLLRAAVLGEIPLQIVYVEPADYARSAAPAPGLIYDLSERIEGISPIPGFVSLRRFQSEHTALVALLGFEGARFSHIAEEAQAAQGKTVPIIGVPGFRPEYPFSTYSGNRMQLESGYLSAAVRYAKANCPFDLFHVLHEVSRDFPQDFLRVAPIGTKPHGLGAVLFAISRQGQVELLYDHPVRKQKRTSGEARVCVYDTTSFVESELFRVAGAI